MSTGFNLGILGDGSTSWCNRPQRSRRAEERLLPKPFLTQPKDKCFSSIFLSAAELWPDAAEQHPRLPPAQLRPRKGLWRLGHRHSDARSHSCKSGERNKHPRRAAQAAPAQGRRGQDQQSGRRKANESLILQAKETPPMSCITWKKRRYLLISKEKSASLRNLSSS